MKFVCEICKKQHDKMEDAEACEILHKKSAQEEKAYIDEINRLANEYISKYRKMPLIEVPRTMYTRGLKHWSNCLSKILKERNNEKECDL